MADEHSELTNQSPTLTDDQIVTERKLPRRSFLATGGALLAGAAAFVSGARASALQDPDKKRTSDADKTDPDQKKSSDPDKKESDPDQQKSEDPDKKKASDPDKKKQSDPDH